MQKTLKIRTRKPDMGHRNEFEEIAQAVKWLRKKPGYRLRGLSMSLSMRVIFTEKR
jgi:hypothetical protein